MGVLLPMLVLGPLGGAVLLALLPARIRPWLTVGLAAVLAAAVVVLVGVVAGGEVLHYQVAGWAPPLGIELLVDPFSAAMLAMTAGVSLPVLIYATGRLTPAVIASIAALKGSTR